MSTLKIENNMQQAWLLLIYGDERLYKSHEGYKDSNKLYTYDNFVPNHRRINESDLAILQGRKEILGFAQIKEIKVDDGTKRRLRCPQCNQTDVRERRKKKPQYVCHDGHEFEFNEAKQEEVNCKIYTAHFGETFIPLKNNSVSIKFIQSACPKLNKQLAMQLVELKRIERDLLERIPTLKQLLDSSTFSRYIKASDAEDIEPELNSIDMPYHPTDGDYRQIVFRQIRARRGQAKFRKALQERYGGSCMVTGCQLLDIVEAAHISPYQGDKDNHPENGLLLRADLHTLFDLDLMGIEPISLIINFHPIVLTSGYKIWSGQTLLCSQVKPSKSALEKRWELFKMRLLQSEI